MKRDHVNHGVSTSVERKFKDPKGDELTFQKTVDAGIDAAEAETLEDEDNDQTPHPPNSEVDGVE
jgi:hypothetical protein